MHLNTRSTLNPEQAWALYQAGPAAWAEWVQLNFNNPDARIDFSGTTFTEPALFTNFPFLRNTNFERCVFEQTADFTGATFAGQTNFKDSYFAKSAIFSHLIGTHHYSDLIFQGAVFCSSFKLSASAVFSIPPDFTQTTFQQLFSLAELKIAAVKAPNPDHALRFKRLKQLALENKEFLTAEDFALQEALCKKHLFGIRLLAFKQLKHRIRITWRRLNTPITITSQDNRTTSADPADQQASGENQQRPLFVRHYKKLSSLVLVLVATGLIATGTVDWKTLQNQFQSLSLEKTLPAEWANRLGAEWVALMDAEPQTTPDQTLKPSSLPTFSLDPASTMALYHQGVEQWNLWVRHHAQNPDIKASFSGLTFTQDADFANFLLPPNTLFSGTTFEQTANFQHARFLGTTLFDSAEFKQEANFTLTQFTGRTSFQRARFLEQATFRNAQFIETTSFEQAQFFQELDMQGVHFIAHVSFEQTELSKASNFTHIRFLDTASFANTHFANQASFQSSAFKHIASFRAATFSEDVFFNEATFSRGADFIHVIFLKSSSFRNTIFGGKADFRQSHFTGSSNWQNALFQNQAHLSHSQFNSITSFKEASFRAVSFAETLFSGPVSFRNSQFFERVNFSGSEFFSDAYFTGAYLASPSDIQVATFFANVYQPELQNQNSAHSGNLTK
ncbi:MAG: pentapeptide repeat-containing protein [Gammaproteobacteria bacterium]